jgi:hypothetical protein
METEAQLINLNQKIRDMKILNDLILALNFEAAVPVGQKRP